MTIVMPCHGGCQPREAQRLSDHSGIGEMATSIAATSNDQASGVWPLVVVPAVGFFAGLTSGAALVGFIIGGYTGWILGLTFTISLYLMQLDCWPTQEPPSRCCSYIKGSGGSFSQVLLGPRFFQRYPLWRLDVFLR